MLSGNHIAVVMPASNAAKTLEKSVNELPDVVDIGILVDDKSSRKTIDLARKLVNRSQLLGVKREALHSAWAGATKSLL
jgi:hypothetical protein